jgi:hypothetical protein
MNEWNRIQKIANIKKQRTGTGKIYEGIREQE